MRSLEAARDPLIRRATLSDAHEACQLVRRSIAELCTDDHLDDQSTLAEWLANKTEANFQSSIGSDRHIALVAEDAHGITGFGLLKVTGELARLYVAPESRFRGVSKAILSALEREAIRLGLNVITSQSTVSARRFISPADISPQASQTKASASHRATR